MRHYLSLDIETVRNERAPEYFETGKAKPDGRLKSEEAIEKNLKEQFDKSGLHWWLNKIVSITAEVITHINKYPYIRRSEKFSRGSKDEASILKSFGDYLVDIDKGYLGISPVGKYSKGFDFPVIVGRFMAHDLGVPMMFYNQRPLRDIEEIFSPYGRNSQVTTLDNIAWGLGIDGKTDMDGSMVQEVYDSGDIEKIVEYNQADNEINIEILRRYRPYVKPKAAKAF